MAAQCGKAFGNLVGGTRDFVVDIIEQRMQRNED
jgi:hypothetical protein